MLMAPACVLRTGMPCHWLTAWAMAWRIQPSSTSGGRIAFALLPMHVSMICMSPLLLHACAFQHELLCKISMTLIAYICSVSSSSMSHESRFGSACMTSVFYQAACTDIALARGQKLLSVLARTFMPVVKLTGPSEASHNCHFPLN